jgi:GNAT superfamily N-acetyltransferase
MKAEFPGDWQRYIRETMSKIALGQYSKDQIWTALDGERVLGFAQHEGERFGPFGVAASERGRGIGAVLLFKCLHTMRDKGLHNAWFLWTDDKTARLYAAAGFAETRRYAVMRKVLE